MAGGIGITPTVAAQLGAMEAITVTGQLLNSTPGTKSGPFRPPQWSKTALYSITVPPSSRLVTGASSATPLVGTEATQNANGSYALSQSVTASQVEVSRSAQIFVFDGTMRVSHSQVATKSQHPIQTGANITDNVVLQPTRLRLEVQMSDAMDSYAPNMWTGSTSKSISAFQQMVALKNQRVFVTVSTRLQTYQNMLIVAVSSDETAQTRHSAHMILELEETFLVNVATVALSARPATTDSTTLGTKQAVPVPASVTSNNALPSSVYSFLNTPDLTAAYGSVAGAGVFSSNPTATIPALNP